MVSDTLFNIFARLEVGADKREKEFVEIRVGRRTQKFVVLQRQRCNHQDGRFGILLTVCKAGRHGLHGSVVFEAFEPPSGDIEFLGESPDQPRDLARNHETDCTDCGGSGRDRALGQLCRRCHGGGRVARTPAKPERKVTLIEW
jgi:hypothetical protein